MTNTFSIKKAFTFGFKAAWNNIATLFAIFFATMLAIVPVIVVGFLAVSLYYKGVDFVSFLNQLNSNMSFFQLLFAMGWFSIIILLIALITALIAPGFYKIALDVYDTGTCTYKTIFSQYHKAFAVAVLYFLPQSIMLIIAQELLGFSLVSWEQKVVSILAQAIWFWLYGAVPFLLIENKITISDVLLNRQWKKTALSIINWRWILLGFLGAAIHAMLPLFYFVVLFVQAYVYRKMWSDNF